MDDHKIKTNLRQKFSGPMKFTNSQYKKIPYKVNKIPCKYNRTAGYWKMEIDLKTRPRRALQGKSNTRPEYQLVRSGYLSKYPPGLVRRSRPLYDEKRGREPVVSAVLATTQRCVECLRKEGLGLVTSWTWPLQFSYLFFLLSCYYRC